MHLTAPADVERARGTVPVSAVFFDALALEGRDLRKLPLAERKALLALTRARPRRHPLRRPRGRAGRGLLRGGGRAAAGGHRRQARREPLHRRSHARVAQDQVPPAPGVRHRRLDRSAGRRAAGSARCTSASTRATASSTSARSAPGFDEATLRLVWDRLQPLKRPTSPFDAGTPTGRGHHWVEPTLVAEVRFTEWTEEGGIRHPAFLGLRADKSPRECRRETRRGLPRSEQHSLRAVRPHARPRRPAAGGCPPAASARWRRYRRTPTRPIDRRVVVTNPTKVFWPDEGYTKSDLVGYYESVAPWLLPYLRERPVVLTRYPDGIKGKSFFQKDAPTWVPSWVHTERIRAEGVERDIDYFIVDDVETLRYVANTGTIPLHLWASRLHALDRPDWLVLDLDPKGAPFTDVVKIALAHPAHPRASWSCRATRRRRARPACTSCCRWARATPTRRRGPSPACSPRWPSRRCRPSRPSPG